MRRLLGAIFVVALSGCVQTVSCEGEACPSTPATPQGNDAPSHEQTTAPTTAIPATRCSAAVSWETEPGVTAALVSPSEGLGKLAGTPEVWVTEVTVAIEQDIPSLRLLLHLKAEPGERAVANVHGSFNGDLPTEEEVASAVRAGVPAWLEAPDLDALADSMRVRVTLVGDDFVGGTSTYAGTVESHGVFSYPRAALRFDPMAGLTHEAAAAAWKASPYPAQGNQSLPGPNGAVASVAARALGWDGGNGTWFQYSANSWGHRDLRGGGFATSHERTAESMREAFARTAPPLVDTPSWDKLRVLGCE